MASSAGIQTALHFLDSESNQILRSDKKGFERCPVHSVRFSGFTVDTDSGVLRWENTHSSHDDRAFVAVVRDIVGASTLHTYAVPSAAHVLKSCITSTIRVRSSDGCRRVAEKNEQSSQSWRRFSYFGLGQKCVVVQEVGRTVPADPNE